MCELGKCYFKVCLVDRSKMVDKQKKQHLLKTYFLLRKEAVYRLFIDTKLKCHRWELNPCPFSWQSNTLTTMPHILHT